MDYNQWRTLVEKLADRPEQLDKLYNSVFISIQGISNVGFFLNFPIDNTSDFLYNIIPRVLRSFLNFGKTSQLQKQIITKFIELFISFANQGLLTIQDYSITILNAIFESSKKPLYVSNKKSKIFEGYVQTAIVKFKIVNTLMTVISELVQSLEYLSSCIKIVSYLHNYDATFDFPTFYRESFNAITRVTKLCLSLINVKQVVECMNNIQPILPLSNTANRVYITSILDELMHFINSKNLEQRIQTFKAIQDYIAKVEFRKYIAQYFSQNISILTEVDYHSEYSDAIGDILANIASFHMLSDENIKVIWSTQQKLNANEKATFLNIFAKITEGAELQIIEVIIQCTLETETLSIQWFDFIDALAKILDKRNDTNNVFAAMKDKIWELAFSDGFEYQQYAQKCLCNMISCKASALDISRIVESMADENSSKYCISLLTKLITSDLEIPEDTINNLFDGIITLIKNFQTTNDDIFIFIKLISNKVTEKITQEQINNLHFLNSSEYFSLLIVFLKKKIIDEQLVNSITMNTKIEDIDIDFYHFIKYLIYEEKPDFQITELPFPNEDILWKFAVMPSAVQHKFARFLCKVFASNKITSLSDQEMIDYFLQKWVSLFHSDSCDTEIIIYLLQCFVEVIESVKPDRAPPHIINTPYQIQIYCEKPTINTKMEVQSYETTGSLLFKLQKKYGIVVSSSQLMIDTRRLKFYEYLSNYKPTKIIVKAGKKEKNSKKLHNRTVVPSEIIMEQDWFIELYNHLEDSSEATYQFLNHMPMIPKLQKLEFPSNFPYKYAYNFLSLLIEKEPNELVENLPTFLETMYSYVDKTDEDTIYHECINLFLTYIKRISSHVQEQVFEYLILLAKKNIEFDEVKKTLYDVFMGKPKLQCFSPDLFIFNDPVQTKKEFFLKAYDLVEIPISSYIDILRDNSSSQFPSNEFFQSLKSHLTIDQDEQSKNQLSILILNLLSNVSSSSLSIILEIVEKLLVFNIFNEEQQDSLLNHLLNRFFTFDIEEDDKIALNSASTCLVKFTYIEKYKSQINEVLTNLHVKRPPFSRYNIQGDDCTRSKTNVVGLKNLGMTCYLNSTLQQLYALKPIRNVVMSYKGDDAFLRQLSSLFVSMKYATMKVVSTRSLIDNWVTWDGQQLNVHVQQDSFEFLQNIIDRLVGMTDILNGFITHMIEGIDVEYQQENREPFTTFEVEVNHFSNLKLSLENFTKPSYFTGGNKYYIESSKCKIDAKQVDVIEIAPPVLILHLKRFEYNLKDMCRNKISDTFDVPFDLDISPYCRDQVDPYHLTGVIVHKGRSANSGHYISFIRKKKGWILCDDETTSYTNEQTVRNYASGQITDTTGYILIYQRPYICDIPKVSMNQEIIDQVRQSNEENKIARLLCCQGYYTLMRELSSINNLDFLNICIRYGIDSLPFANCAKNSEIFFSNLVDKFQISKEARFEFLSDLIPDYLPLVLYHCPEVKIRDGIATLIELSFNSYEDPAQLIELLINMMMTCLDNYSNIDQLFRVLNAAYDFYKDKYDFSGLSHTFAKFVSQDIPTWAQTTPVSTTYLYESLKLTHFLILASKLQYSDEDLALMKTNEFLMLICISASSPSSVATYVVRFYSQEDFIKYMKENCPIIPALRAISLMFYIVGDETISYALNLKFKVNNSRLTTNFDIASVFLVYSCENKDFTDMLIRLIKDWLGVFMLDPNRGTRNIAMNLAAFIIGHPNLKDWSYPDFPEDLFIPNVTFKVKENIDNSVVRIILKSLLKMIPELSTRIYTKQLMVENIDQFVALIEQLLIITQDKPGSIYNIVNLFEVVLKNSVDTINTQSLQLMRLINRFDINVEIETLIFCLSSIDRLSAKNYPILLQFLHPYLKQISKFEPNELIRKPFLKHVAFAPSSLTEPDFKQIAEYLAVLCDSFKSEMISDLQTNISKWGKNNYSALLIVLEKCDVKRPLASYFKQALTQPQYFNLNTLIEKTLELSSTDIRDVSLIESLVRRKDLQQDMREILLNMLPERSRSLIQDIGEDSSEEDDDDVQISAPPTPKRNPELPPLNLSVVSKVLGDDDNFEKNDNEPVFAEAESANTVDEYSKDFSIISHPKSSKPHIADQYSNLSGRKLFQELQKKNNEDEIRIQLQKSKDLDSSE